MSSPSRAVPAVLEGWEIGAGNYPELTVGDYITSAVALSIDRLTEGGRQQSPPESRPSVKWLGCDAQIEFTARIQRVLETRPPNPPMTLLDVGFPTYAVEDLSLPRAASRSDRSVAGIGSLAIESRRPTWYLPRRAPEPQVKAGWKVAAVNIRVPGSQTEQSAGFPEVVALVDDDRWKDVSTTRDRGKSDAEAHIFRVWLLPQP